MRSARFGLLLSILVLAFPVWAQQARTPTTSSGDQMATVMSPAPQDPRAVSTVNQALLAAGGLSAIRAIADYTGTGTITYRMPGQPQGSLTIRGTTLDQVRMDATLAGGVRSQAISDGTLSIKGENESVWHAPFEAPMSPGRMVLPYLLLASAFNNPGTSNSTGYALSYKGIVELSGHPAYDIQLEFIIPGLYDPDGLFREYHSIEFFLDTSTLLVVRTQESIPNHDVRQIQYSDYRQVSGVLVPFSITAEASSFWQTWVIQLDKITFNAGLQDSDFRL
jgi:hypothetical protein